MQSCTSQQIHDRTIRRLLCLRTAGASTQRSLWALRVSIYTPELTPFTQMARHRLESLRLGFSNRPETRLRLKCFCMSDGSCLRVLVSAGLFGPSHEGVRCYSRYIRNSLIFLLRFILLWTLAGLCSGLVLATAIVSSLPVHRYRLLAELTHTYLMHT